MIIHSPCVITARLLPGIKIGDSFLSIAYGEMTFDGRQGYIVYIDSPGWNYSFSDMNSGVGGGTLQNGLISALSFLSYAGESKEMFPSHVCEWAYLWQDELSTLHLEMEESSEIFIQE
jgi:hypothetical protein